MSWAALDAYGGAEHCRAENWKTRELTQGRGLAHGYRTRLNATNSATCVDRLRRWPRPALKWAAGVPCVVQAVPRKPCSGYKRGKRTAGDAGTWWASLQRSDGRGSAQGAVCGRVVASGTREVERGEARAGAASFLNERKAFTRMIVSQSGSVTRRARLCAYMVRGRGICPSASKFLAVLHWAAAPRPKTDAALMNCSGEFLERRRVRGQLGARLLQGFLHRQGAAASCQLQASFGANSSFRPVHTYKRRSPQPTHCNAVLAVVRRLYERETWPCVHRPASLQRHHPVGSACKCTRRPTCSSLAYKCTHGAPPQSALSI